MEQHKMSLWAAILMNINIMVGVGILFYPALMAKEAGYASFIAWPVVALIFVPVVLSIATIARIFPGAGSFYTYSKNIISPTAGFISGWTFFLGYTGVTALMTIVLRGIVFELLKNNFNFYMNPLLFNAIFITFISLLSLVNITMVGRIQSVGTLFKLLPLFLVLAIFAFHWNPSFSVAMPHVLNLPSIVPMAVFGYWGFECCCAVSHLIKGEKCNASVAILSAFFITVAIYSLFHFGLLHIMGASNLATYGVEDVVRFIRLPIPAIKFLLFLSIKIAMVLAFINAVFSIFTANSSTLRTMAKEGLFPFSKQLTLMNKNQRPWVAIFTQGVLTFIMAMLITDAKLLTSFTNIGIIVSYLFTLISLFIIQKKEGSGKIIITSLAFISLIIFTYFSWIGMGANHTERFISLSPLLVTFTLGMIMFFALTNRRRRTA